MISSQGTSVHTSRLSAYSQKENPSTQKFSKNYEIHILPALSVVQQRKELSLNWQQNQHMF